MADTSALDDPARLEAVRATGLFHPETEAAFDRLARVARRALDATFSLVSLVGQDRQVTKGRAGSDLDEIAVIDGICRHTVAAGAPLAIPDTAGDDRVCDLEVVAGGVRAYLGVPLAMPAGPVVGSFMVASDRPRGWADDDVQTLQDLAGAVVAEIAARGALRERGEARFRALFDGVSQLTGLLDADGAVLEANRTALDFAGLERADVVGRALWDTLPLPHDVEARHRAAVRQAAAGGAARYEETVWDGAGRARVLDVRVTPAPGSPGLLLLEGRDVTEAVRLRRVQSAMMVGQAGTWDLDVATGRVVTHGAVPALFGLEPEGDHALEDYFGRVHPDDVGRVREVTETSIERAADHSIDYRVVLGDGAVRWVRSRGVVLTDDDGAPARMIGALADVTDQRLEAEAAARTATGLQVALDAARMGRWEADLEAAVVVQDPRARALHGRPPGPGPGAHDEAMLTVHPDDRDRLGEAYQAVVERGGRLDAEYRTLRPDGPPRWVRATGEAVDGGRLVGVVRDVTAEREAKAALRESKDRFQRLADAAPALLWVTDPDGACTFLSRSWYEYTGQAEAEALGFGWLEAVHPDDAGRARAVFLAANEAAEPFQLEYRLRRHDGVYRWAIDAARPHRGPGGAFLGYVGSVLDIEGRRQAEAALRASEGRLALALSAAQLGTFERDVASGATAFDGRTRAVLGLEADTATFADVLERVAEPDRAAFPRATGALQADPNRGPIAFEYRLAEGDRTVRASVRGVAGPDGALARVVGTVQDVTEQKRTEAALRESEERYRTLFESVDVGFCIIEVVYDGGAPADYRFLETNPAFVAQTGLEDAVGKTAYELVPGLERHWVETYAAVVETGEPVRFSQGAAAMGRQFDVYATRVGGPESRRAALLFTDVTEQERTEAALRESEARYRTLFESVTLGFALIDLVLDDDGRTVDYRHLETNPTFTDQTGLEDAGGRLVSELVPGLDPVWFERYGGVAATGEPLRVLDYVGGLGRWYDVYAARVGGEGSRRVGVLFTDVTEQKEAEAALRESEARFRGTFENAAVGIAHVGLEGSWLRVNDRLCEIAGYTRDELLGRTFQDVTHPDDLGLDLGQFGRLLGGEIDHYQVEKRYLHRDGHAVWINLTVAPNRDADGEIDYVISVVEDVSEKKAAEAALRALNDDLEDRVAARTAELERSNAELDQFAYVASHDLKAPLRAIDSLATWIEEDAGAALPPESARHLALLRRRAERMEGLLDSLLTYSRAGRREAAPERVDLEAVVREAVAVVAPPDGIRVDLEGAFPTLTTPRAPLELVVRNLVGNAIKHHDRPDGRVTVSARTVQRGGRGWAEVTVEDDGPGIAPEYQDRVFGMFQTLRPRDEVEGSGMGLAIVKKAVETRAGTVAVESENRGARFRFTWPLDADAAAT